MKAGKPQERFPYFRMKEEPFIRIEMEIFMIEVTKLSGQKILIKPDLMEYVEETPDTVIAFTTGRKIIVKESRQEVKNLVKSYRKDIFA